MRAFPLLLFLFSVLAVSANVAGEAPEAVSENRAVTLSSLLQAIEGQEESVQTLRQELVVAVSQSEKERLERQLAQQTEQLAALKTRFRESAAGVDVSPFQVKQEEAFSWEKTLGKILEPILDEVEEATATSRRKAELEKEKSLSGERAATARKAVANLNDLLPGVEEPALRSVLEEQLREWEDLRLIAENRAEAARYQLEELASRTEGVIGGTTSFIRDFLAERGLNLLLGILAAFGVFFGLRLVLMVLQKFRTGEQPGSLGNRLFLLFTNLLSIVGAIAALLIAFSAAGDLFLLGIVLIFLIGAAWAGIQVIPQFIESIKLVLNIGMVREDQRLFFDGVPWNVDVLGFSCILGNKALDEARLMLPVRRLVGLHSRPWCKDEEPFPMVRGEWVQLADGTIGRSILQNPGTVVLEEWGGAEITYATPNFLEQAPKNLSRKGVRVVSRFGIDYRHQEVCTRTVREWFQEALEGGLRETVSLEAEPVVTVYFASAGASSLDYEVHVDLQGVDAANLKRVEFAIQRLLVDCCQSRGLVIPFQQITLHVNGG